MNRPSPFQAILPLCLALLFMAVASPAAPVFRYLEQTGTDSCIFTWRLERERDTATLSVVQRQGSETFLSRNTAAGETLAWQYVHQPDTDVRAEREDDRIRLSGRFQGKTVDEVEQKLLRVTPDEFKKDAHHWLILHGRYVCKARKPECARCVVIDLCAFKGKTV